MLIKKLDKFTDNLIGMKAELLRLVDESALGFIGKKEQTQEVVGSLDTAVNKINRIKSDIRKY